MRQSFTLHLRMLLVLVLALGTSYASWGQTYAPIALTGFNQDVIAEGTGAATTLTTYDVDGAAGTGYSFMSANYVNPSGTTNTTTRPIPNNGTITSLASGTTGLTYQLAGFAANNVLRIPATGNAGGGTGTGADAGTVTFTTPSAASVVYVLATGGGAAITNALNVTVTFTDATTQTFTGQTLPDWFTPNGATVAFQGFGRVARTTASTIDLASSTTPNLYQLAYTLSAANATKPIASITFGKTTTAVGVINVFAVSTATFAACTTPPTAGTAVASPASLCAGGTSTLTLTGISATLGLTYQWQSSTTSATTGFTNITGATSNTYTTPALTQTTYYQAVVTCSGQSATSTVATVALLVPTYATVPYTQGFENTWASRCNTDDAPDASWLNTPATGSNSWRRDDDGASAGWAYLTGATYTPAGSNAGGASSSHSARFHNYGAPSSSIGTLDLYVNLSGGTGTPTLKFDYRNPDTNSVTVLLSTDGGATFATAPLQTLGTQSAWTSYTIALPSSVTATTVIRFRAVSNFGNADTGLDNVSVSYISCAAPSGLTVTTAGGASVTASVAFTPVSGATNYAFTITPAVAGAPTTVTASPISLTGLAFSTSYTVTLTTNCGGGTTSQAASYTFTTPCGPPAYATVPYTQGFEATWINRCDTRDVPDNSWANTPATGNNSWRRDDDGASANWGSTSGSYSPAGSQGSSHSARFHSYNTPNGTSGTFDLYVNLSAAGAKRLTFDYVNVSTSGSKLDILLSTDGGATFSTTPLLTITSASTFTAQSVNVASTSATSIIRFRATSDFGSYDIGVDNVQVVTLPAVDIAPTALATPTSTQGCYGSAETVSVVVTNQGGQTINFATNPAAISVVVTTPGSPQTLTGSITSGTLAAGATQTVTLTPTLNMTTLGTYTFAITATVTGDANTANDLLTPSPTRTAAAPVAGTLSPATTNICTSGTATLTLAGAANGSIQYQSSSSATGTFTNISGATSATYTTPVLTTTTYYRAQVTCGTNVATSNVSTVTVNVPTVASTNTPVAICAGSTATLTATASAGGSVRFFSTATGGTALTTTTAGSYTTPALTANATYYAEAFTGSTASVGPLTNAIGAGTQSTAPQYLTFDVAQATTLLGVNVYPGAAGNIIIEYRSSTGTVLQSATVAVTASQVGIKTYIPLGFNLVAGTAQRLGLNTSSVAAYRNSSGASYPYNGGAVTITGNSFDPAYYYWFYDWSVGGECIGAAARTAIQVNVTQPATAGFSYPTTAVCASAATTLTPTLATGATAGTYTLPTATGLSINATTGVVTVTTAATAGTYTVTNTVPASGACGPVTSTATFTISPAATSTFSYPAGPYCTSGTTNPTPTITGTTGGTFSSTTGLTISATTGVITLSSSTSGTYTVTYTVAGACGTVSSTQTVTINAPATAGFSYPTATACAGTATTLTPTLTTGATAGTYSLPATTGLSINATTGVVTVAATAAAGTYTVTNTVTSGGCATVTSTATFTLTAPTTATFSYAGSPYCTTGAPITPTITGTTGGTFSSTTGLTINATTGVITPSSSTAGTYTVTYTVAGPCGSSSTQSVTITTPQTASFSYATPASGTACVGSTGSFSAVLATGSAAGTFTVSPTTGLTVNATTGAISLTGATAGTYTVTNTVAASGGCAATTSTATFTVNPLPATPTLTTSGTAGTGITLTSSATTGNQFYLNGVLISGATGQTYLVNSGTKNGAYTVVTTSSAGCSSAASAPVTITVTGTVAATAGTSLTLYPNPTRDGLLTLELQGYQEAVTLQVVNALGQRVYQGTVSGTTQTRQQVLDLSALPTGVYLLQARTASGSVEIRRFVRE